MSAIFHQIANDGFIPIACIEVISGIQISEVHYMILLVNVDVNDMHQVCPPLCVYRRTSRRIIICLCFYSYKVQEYLESTLRIVQYIAMDRNLRIAFI